MAFLAGVGASVMRHHVNLHGGADIRDVCGPCAFQVERSSFGACHPLWSSGALRSNRALDALFADGSFGALNPLRSNEVYGVSP